MLNFMVRFTIPIMMLIVANIVVAKDYTINEKDRSLILPRHTGEFILGSAKLEGNERQNNETILFFRYALSDNFEISRIGFRYRFLNINKQQWTFRMQNYGLGVNESGDFFHHSEFGIDGKQNVHSLFSLLYNAGYFWSDSHEKDGKTSETRMGLAVIARLNQFSSLELGYQRRFISNFSVGSANLYSSKFMYNIYPTLDGILIYKAGNFNKAVDSILFNESFDKMLGVAIAWRF